MNSSNTNISSLFSSDTSSKIKFPCRHLICYHGQYHERASFCAKDKLNKHEKLIAKHPCFNNTEENCECCSHWKAKHKMV